MNQINLCKGYSKLRSHRLRANGFNPALWPCVCVCVRATWLGLRNYIQERNQNCNGSKMRAKSCEKSFCVSPEREKAFLVAEKNLCVYLMFSKGREEKKGRENKNSSTLAR